MPETKRAERPSVTTRSINRVLSRELGHLLDQHHDGEITTALGTLVDTSDGTTVAIRNDASEAIVYDEPTHSLLADTLLAYEIRIDESVSSVNRREEIASEVDVKQWIQDRTSELDWVHPWWR